MEPKDYAFIFSSGVLPSSTPPPPSGSTAPPARSRTSSRHSSAGRKRSGDVQVSSESDEDEHRPRVRVTPSKRATESGRSDEGGVDRPSATPATGSDIPSGSRTNLGSVVPAAQDPLSQTAARRPIIGGVSFNLLSSRGCLMALMVLNRFYLIVNFCLILLASEVNR